MTTDAGTGGTSNQPGDAGADGKSVSEGASKPDTSADPTAKPDAAKPDANDPAKLAADAAGKDVEYKFEMPEGFELDQARLTEFTTIAKELKLPQDAAQKLVNLATSAEKARVEGHVKQVGEWADAVKKDAVLGGDKLAESSAVARKAIELGPPELKAFLNETGLGNHPLVFKWAHAIGKAMSEDAVAKSTTAPAGDKSAAQVLYGDTSKT